MPEHKFAVGQAVDFSPGLGGNPARDQYVVVRLMPLEGNTPQYRIKSKRDGQERVAQETQLTRLPGMATNPFGADRIGKRSR